MYLKEIKIQGFKSFADRINIELNNGLIGIVGPNGSGKSNIVDAVRWVLGEQSIKSLRGDVAMTDVIFSGSKSRNPLNVASVTLIFDNSDKYIPLDFTEISVRRKVYRDGTNEYFINNEKCRLKDITDLFLDSGSSKESFNIISQGKIEEILTNRPTDRRVIFEEAAGVLKYKKRKEDAMRKLERTHDNMNRVNDIINEVEMQIEPLKDQKEKAIKYIDVKSELENIEISLITEDITNINYNYQLAKKKIDDINNEIVNISAANTKNEVIIEKHKKQQQEKEREINNYQKQLLEATSLVEQLNAEKQIVLERKKYEVDNTKLHTNLVDLKERQLQIDNYIFNLENEINVKTIELEQISNSYKNLSNEIQEVNNRKKDLELDLSKILRDSHFNNNKIDQLRESIDSNSALPSAVLKVLNNPKLRGIHNALGNIIEVSEKYSLAITTTLGMASSNIITDNEICAKEAIVYLKNNQLGRATFLPLNVIKPRGIDFNIISSLEKINGFINTADNLVKYDNKYNNIVKNQLGNVIVATDIDAANIISKHINYRYRIVTIDGEIINVGGSITGGNQSRVRNIILEKYELEKHLKKQNEFINFIKELENKINDNDHLLKSLEDKLYLINKNKINQETIIQNFQIQINNNKKTLEQIQKEINGTNNVINNSLSEEEDKILKQYYSALKSRDNIKNKLDFLIKEKETLNDKIEENEYLLKRENSLFITKNKELQNLEVEVNRMDVKLDNLLNVLSETYSITYEAACSHYKLEIDNKIARTKVSQLKKELQTLGMVNLNAVEEYDRVSERYNFLIKQRDDLVSAKNTLLDIIEEMDTIMEKEFMDTFNVIDNNFNQTFKELFKGGYASLKLTDPKNILETGIEIVASPPGKKLTSINLLSGGEKTLTAISLLFAILKSRPVPFCILDEVEAALDEVNVESFGQYLLKLKEKTQFILITHKKKTMEYVDLLYGVTMQESGVSKLVSVNLRDI